MERRTKYLADGLLVSLWLQDVLDAIEQPLVLESLIPEPPRMLQWRWLRFAALRRRPRRLVRR